MCEAAALLLRELKRRFRKYTDPGDTDHESVFIVATSLDPRLLLRALQAVKGNDKRAKWCQLFK